MDEKLCYLQINKMYFDTILQFLGQWYIVKANDISISCATIKLESVNSSTKFDIKQSINYRSLPFLQHIVTRSGRIRVVDEDNPAGMKIKWHWSK